MPAGNWSLIGSEEERDQLALCELQIKTEGMRQNCKKREGLGGEVAGSQYEEKNSGLLLIR